VLVEDLVVYCADIGSVGKQNFGWARLDAGGGSTQVGRDIEDLVAATAADLRNKRPVALGFESPLWVPLPADSRELGKGRPNEGSPSWSGGPGGNVFATGAAQVPWILRELRNEVINGCAYLEWEDFYGASNCRLFLWEAFVAGKAKAPKGLGTSHTGDAEIGAKAFVDALPDPNRATQTWKPVGEVFSLLGAAMLLTGWSGDQSVLHEACLVVRAMPRDTTAGVLGGDSPAL
jgi:hypothetical protein